MAAVMRHGEGCLTRGCGQHVGAAARATNGERRRLRVVDQGQRERQLVERAGLGRQY